MLSAEDEDCDALLGSDAPERLDASVSVDDESLSKLGVDFVPLEPLRRSVIASLVGHVHSRPEAEHLWHRG